MLVASAACTAASTQAATKPLVVVVRHGGLCITGSECKTALRITDATISGAGYRARPLSAHDRRVNR